MASPWESSSHEIRVSAWTVPVCSAPSTIQVFPRTVTKLPIWGIGGFDAIVPSLITTPAPLHRGTHISPRHSLHLNFGCEAAGQTQDVLGSIPLRRVNARYRQFDNGTLKHYRRSTHHGRDTGHLGLGICVVLRAKILRCIDHWEIDSFESKATAGPGTGSLPMVLSMPPGTVGLETPDFRSCRRRRWRILQINLPRVERAQGECPTDRSIYQNSDIAAASTCVRAWRWMYSRGAGRGGKA